MAYNRFGAVFSTVVSLYPGTDVTDYGGQTTVEEAIDRAVDRIAQSLPEDVYGSLFVPEWELVLSRATAGQTVLPAVARAPVLAGTVHVWHGSPMLFASPPQLATEVGSGIVEDPSTAFSIVLATGVITMAAQLRSDDQVYASYWADTDNAAFAVPSLARLAVRGAAAELGARLYSEANQQWKLVDAYQQIFADDLKALKSGDMTPDEVASTNYWEESQHRSSQVSSVRLWRG